MSNTRAILRAIRDHVQKTGTLEGAPAEGLTSSQEYAILMLWTKHRERFVENLTTCVSMRDPEVWLQGVRFWLSDEPPPPVH